MEPQGPGTTDVSTRVEGRLSGKRALITGAGSGMGRAAAIRFAAEGAAVGVLDLDDDAAKAVAASIEAADGRALALPADLTDEVQVEAAFAKFAGRFGGLDVVVANAAVQLFGEDARVHELETAVWERTVAVNLRGAFLTCKHGVRALLAAGGGSVVVTGSPTGLFGIAPGFTAYSASKAGTFGLMRVIATDFAAAGIRVNAVVPGFTDTPLVASITSDPEERRRLESTIPMRRAGRPEEAAAMMAWLASDESSYATGAIFTIDGGMTAV